jgi:hypothetical protein
MMFKEIIFFAVTIMRSPYIQNEILLILEEGGIYTHHCALKD